MNCFSQGLEYGVADFMITETNRNMWKYRDYRQKYQRLLQKADLNIANNNPYKFRHTYCSNLIKQNVNIKHIQYLMGDSTIDMVLKVYAHVKKKQAFEHGSVIPQKMATIYQTLEN